MVVIPLATTLNSPSVDIDDWYNLIPCHDMRVAPTGSIHVIMTYFSEIGDDMIDTSYLPGVGIGYLYTLTYSLLDE